MKENTAMNMVRFSVILSAIFLLMINSVGMVAAEVDKADSAVQPIIDNLAKNENAKVTMEEIHFHNILGRSFLVILPEIDMEGNFIRGASGNGDILVYMKKGSNYILAGKLDGNSYELKEMRGKVGLIKRSHASGEWAPPTAYELMGDNFVESDKYEVSKRNNTNWFDVNARISLLYDLSDEVTIKTILERALEEGKKKSGHYGYISVHIYQNDKLAVEFEGIGENNLDTTEKVITASKIDNIAKRNQEQIILELKKGNVSAVRSMIENGTNVDTRDEEGIKGDTGPGPTLLMLMACGKVCGINLKQEEQIALLKILLDNGADVNARTHWGETVLTYAVAGEGHDIKTEEETKGGASRLPIVKMILDRGAKTNVGSAYEHITNGDACLTRAAIHGYYQIIGLLFQYGAHEGLDQAYKFAKGQNHTQTAKLIQDKFWSNFKSNCLTNSGFSKSLMIGDPVDTENYAISIVQGKRTTSDSDINTTICIFDKMNEKTEFAEPSAFKEFPFALDALAKSKDKQLQQETQKSICNAAQQLLSTEPYLDQSKKFNCLLDNKFNKFLMVGEPANTENYSVFLIQGKRFKTDTNLSTAICIYDKRRENIKFLEPNAFTTYPFAWAELSRNDDDTRIDPNKSNCNEARQLLNNYMNSNKLTRIEAKKLIQDKLNEEKHHHTDLLPSSYSKDYNPNIPKDELCYGTLLVSKDAIKNLAQEGYLKTSISGYGSFFGVPQVSCNYTLTDKAKPYVSSIDAVSKDIYIIVSKKNIVSVDGITKRSDTESMVEYSYTFEQTPIGKAFLTNESDLGIIKKGRAHFVLFDDGWKVESPLR
ncbi:MAG: ankyrin repeat domain-containing protein [Candidatus Contendobacter sp.]|nr:ankyrin repeat domain-containing protein [Candidatus Contendobacter sp.]MDS4058166.1 ankyrin repeat domain-containing protein [Candidatus Contendobacter sp.]